MANDFSGKQKLALAVEVFRKAHLETVFDLKLNGTVSYRAGWDLRIPKSGGIYLIHDLRGVLYVGRSNNLRRRYNEHSEEVSNHLLKKALNTPFGEVLFSWLQEDDASKQAQIEEQLIQLFIPICNRLQYISNRKKGA